MIKLIKPYIDFDDVKDEFQEIFESGWFTKGKYVEKFVKEIIDYTGAKNAFLTTSATTALTMALKIINIKAGDEVIVSDFSFPATSNVVEDLGAIPIFAEVSLDTFNMLPSDLENKINSKTKAVIFVDALGNPKGIHEIKRICIEKKIPLIEDGACALGSSEYGEKCGNIADITCFSFHPRKLLCTGEGGAITTNCDEYAEKLTVKLNHGATVHDGKFDFVDIGYNYRLPELQSVMGIKQLAKLDTVIISRNKIRNEYNEGLEGLGFSAQDISGDVLHNVQSIVFKVPAGVERNELIDFLKMEGVETTIGTYALSSTTLNRVTYNKINPNSSFLEQQTITFPCYAGVDVNYIVEKIKDYMHVR